MKISENAFVEFHYALVNQDNEVVDGSRGAEPLPYIHGKGNIIPGLEAALEGHEEGDKFNVTIKPEKGYGKRDETLVSIVHADSFAGFDNIEPGMLCQIEDKNGEPLLITITAIDDDEVTIDANHPFAGQILNFEVEVMNVRNATEAELRDGVQ
ncbi:FKBP-type peptidyl-prolyl cis-trans isomerase [Amphritea sp. HPY]|uniref:FKBP-type peptidyl-prolyl cis-trans isomerase n=1 Tax=Amphritea sp. HPY TaxID=3421652 RepID=UPI003D7C6BC4